jgi:2-polyprenyl-3-methyl-5-hydroxy-6-metoxy-1,4-benzoquinol methylase
MSLIDPGYHDRVRDDVFDLVPRGAGRLLDVGGGIGATAVALKRQGYARKITVIDIIDAGFLPEVDEAYTGDLNDAGFLRGLGADEFRYDVILCLDVLEHLMDPWRTVATLHELLAPDGVLIASIPNLRFWPVSWGLFALGRFELSDRGILDRTHLRWFVRDTAAKLMTSSGLKMDQLIGRIPARRWQLANALTGGMARGLFEMQYLIRVSRTGCEPAWNKRSDAHLVQLRE